MTTEQTISLLLVEDDPILVRTVRRLVSRDDRVVLLAAVGGVDEARRFLDEGSRRLDVGLVDLGLPDGSGIDVVRAFNACDPPVPTLVWTIFDDRSSLRAALEAGALGYLLKEDTSRLCDAVVGVCNGESPIHPRMARALVEDVRIDREHPIETLTAREREVLELFMHGHTFSTAADELGISRGTVQGYARELYRKLGVNSKGAAVAMARDYGLR